MKYFNFSDFMVSFWMSIVFNGLVLSFGRLQPYLFIGTACAILGLMYRLDIWQSEKKG